MSVLLLIAYYLALAVAMLWCAAQVISAALGVWALIDSALRPAQYYAAADKRSKNFWVAVNAVAAVVGTFLAYQALLAVYIAGASTGVSFIGLLAVVASAVYLPDVPRCRRWRRCGCAPRSGSRVGPRSADRGVVAARATGVLVADACGHSAGQQGCCPSRW